MNSGLTKHSRNNVVSLSFTTLGIGGRIGGVLDDLGYKTPTEIQAQAIPEILAGTDVLGIAQTGTGKTGAFCLPILERVLQRGAKARSKRPLALIISPTRELAAQIMGETSKYLGRSWIRYCCVTGGVSQKPQEKMLARGIEVLVATPGRLLDLALSGHVDLGDVRHFVLDEADQLLDMGFIRDIKRILKLLPEKRQSLLFSATMPREIEKLAAQVLSQPERIEVTPRAVTVDKVAQGFVNVNTGDKQAALETMLSMRDVRKAIVFTRTKHGANRVAKKLDKHGFGVEVIHGNKSQNARNRALDSFKSGSAWVLVATDVAARGIDIQEVTHVINFELPHEPEVYVHRIGRTARAGASGVAWSLVDQSEQARLKSIERLTKVKPSRIDIKMEDSGMQKFVPVERVDTETPKSTATQKSTQTRKRRSRRRRSGKRQSARAA